MSKVNLGDKVRDTVTEFTGVVIARTEYLNGCARCAIQSLAFKDGLPTDAYWIDEMQLEVVQANAVVIEGATDIDGGPRVDAPV